MDTYFLIIVQVLQNNGAVEEKLYGPYFSFEHAAAIFADAPHVLTPFETKTYSYIVEAFYLEGEWKIINELAIEEHNAT